MDFVSIAVALLRFLPQNAHFPSETAARGMIFERHVLFAKLAGFACFVIWRRTRREPDCFGFLLKIRQDFLAAFRAKRQKSGFRGSWRVGCICPCFRRQFRNAQSQFPRSGASRVLKYFLPLPKKMVKAAAINRRFIQKNNALFVHCAASRAFPIWKSAHPRSLFCRNSQIIYVLFVRNAAIVRRSVHTSPTPSSAPHCGRLWAKCQSVY